MENLLSRSSDWYGEINTRNMQDQVLDSMDLERERGITIKAQTVSLKVNYEGEEFNLNIIDTPSCRFLLRGIKIIISM